MNRLIFTSLICATLFSACSSEPPHPIDQVLSLYGISIPDSVITKSLEERGKLNSEERTTFNDEVFTHYRLGEQLLFGKRLPGKGIAHNGNLISFYSSLEADSKDSFDSLVDSAFVRFGAPDTLNHYETTYSSYSRWRWFHGSIEARIAVYTASDETTLYFIIEDTTLVGQAGRSIVIEETNFQGDAFGDIDMSLINSLDYLLTNRFVSKYVFPLYEVDTIKLSNALFGSSDGFGGESTKVVAVIDGSISSPPELAVEDYDVVYNMLVGKFGAPGTISTSGEDRTVCWNVNSFEFCLDAASSSNGNRLVLGPISKWFPYTGRS